MTSDMLDIAQVYEEVPLTDIPRALNGALRPRFAAVLGALVIAAMRRQGLLRKQAK